MPDNITADVSECCIPQWSMVFSSRLLVFPFHLNSFIRCHDLFELCFSWLCTKTRASNVSKTCTNSGKKKWDQNTRECTRSPLLSWFWSGWNSFAFALKAVYMGNERRGFHFHWVGIKYNDTKHLSIRMQKNCNRSKKWWLHSLTELFLDSWIIFKCSALVGLSASKEVRQAMLSETITKV